MWGLGVLLVVAVATSTALLAEAKGHPPLPWFVFGTFAPVIALVVVAVAVPARMAGPGRRATTPAARALEGRVGRELAGHQGPVSVDGLATRLNMPEGEVADELRTLEGFGLASRDEGGKWELNERGRFATEGVDTSSPA
jgi:hypothetical protein